MTRQKTDEQRKRQIRAAATRCFVRRGFAATRLLDIAREAGLSKGGVYFHYRAKEALFHDILDAQLDALKRRWSFQPGTDQPADLLLGTLVRAHVQELANEPDETRLCNLLVTMAVQEPDFRTKLDSAFRVTRNLYQEVIARGLASGVFHGPDAGQMAIAVHGFVQGLAACSATDEHGKLPMSADAAARLALTMCGANPDCLPAPAPVVTAPSDTDTADTASPDEGTPDGEGTLAADANDTTADAPESSDEQASNASPGDAPPDSNEAAN